MATTKVLFGGSREWKSSDWTASDDRVRGGKSQSFLVPSSKDTTAHFYGNLDIETLGGAGFASQRTTGDERTWDLRGYDGIELRLGDSDGKQYTLILKDDLQPPRPDGREQSSISYEYDFKAASSQQHIPWTAFQATYRGRKKDDAPPLDLGNVKRFSFMMRSFFGSQHGLFSLNIENVSAFKSSKDELSSANAEKCLISDEPSTPRPGYLGGVLRMCGLL